MIQRIQSIFLTITGILSLVAGFITDLIPDDWIDMCLLFLIGILSFFSLFSFKKRKIQMKINYLNIIINVMLISYMVYHLLSSPGGVLSPMKGVEFFVPVLLIILLAMANKYINKDEKLIKSVDRFR
ncbi:DUF4293 family protein [Apibacter muscae]|uniref:DUF4293 domain-containing protein n=1 Tax=Apibacter muscae TaxID=2509004 RepID=UPI0011AD4946|nr:DUF4293 domain-containing protein [Apibacter muscae]TWP30866.1 DUF4293 family protein [Apibacter muscae]